MAAPLTGCREPEIETYPRPRRAQLLEAYINPIFGDVVPEKLTLEGAWHAVLLDTGVREAHRSMKIWRGTVARRWPL